MTHFIHMERAEFRNKLDHFLHPSENIVEPYQLKGRDIALNQMRDCFETPGSQAFIWGPRGVGKTSVGHTACEKHKDIVQVATAIACEGDTSFSQFITDIINKIRSDRRSFIDKIRIPRISIEGVTIDLKGSDYINTIDIQSINQAVDILKRVLPSQAFDGVRPVIIIDEFDRLENANTNRMISALIKQLSVEGLQIKFVFCGVAKNMQDLLHSHESIERYVYEIPLKPISADAIMEICDDIEANFDITFSRGQKIRISQISSGFPHFAHLILKNILLITYDNQHSVDDIDSLTYKSGVHLSTQQVAGRLRTTYETSTQRGSDRYIEILFAAANSPTLRRQFKDIRDDYMKIIWDLKDRDGYDNDQGIRNALNALTRDPTGGVLHRTPPGWYEFKDPMFRSYIRMVAEAAGIELGDESYRN